MHVPGGDWFNNRGEFCSKDSSDQETLIQKMCSMEKGLLTPSLSGIL